MKNYKKAVFFISGICIALVIMAFSTSKSDSYKISPDVEYVTTSDSMPAAIKEIIQSSCIGCHAPGGKALAVAKLNFEEWNNYDHEKQIKKADAMCSKVTKGTMPPKSFLKTHPEAALTEEQIDEICKWVSSLAESK